MDKISPEEIGKYFHVNNEHKESFFELIYESDGQKVTSRIDFQFDKNAILTRSAINKSKVKYSTSYSGQGGFGQDGILKRYQKNVELWVCKIIYFWWWICGKTLWLSS